MNPKTILITGGSRGIGRATADLLARRGHTVFATSRTPDRYQIDAFTLLPLDVTDNDSVRACVRSVIDQAGRIDVLINNAGVSNIAALEEMTIASAQHIFEINLFGVMRMTNVALPHMRQQRYGLIINIGSLAGIIPVPFLGLYCASKFALEGYTFALRGEVRPFGIHASLVDPDDIHTHIVTQGPDIPIADYAETRTRTAAIHAANMAKAPGPEIVAQVIAGVIQNRRPKLRYCVGPNAYSATMKRFLPNAVGEWIIRTIYKL